MVQTFINQQEKVGEVKENIRNEGPKRHRKARGVNQKGKQDLGCPKTAKEQHTSTRTWKSMA